MFGAGWTEMLIIGVVALIVIGPKDLPVVMRRIGQMVGTVRRMGSEFQRELNKTTGLDQIADLRRSITEPLAQTRDEIVREFNRQTATGVEPTGIVKPAEPGVESVYEQIAATSGVAAAPAMMPLATAAEPSPAPAEASIPASASKPKRTPRAKAVPVAAEPEPPAGPPSRRPGKPKAQPATTAAEVAPKRSRVAKPPVSTVAEAPAVPAAAAPDAPAVGEVAPSRRRAKTVAARVAGAESTGGEIVAPARRRASKKA